AGNPEAIRQILRIRQFKMADIAAALPLLARARADTELAAHLPLLVNEFRARENTHLDQLRSRPLHMVAVDPICELVIANLGGAGQSQSLSDLVATIGINRIWPREFLPPAISPPFKLALCASSSAGVLALRASTKAMNPGATRSICASMRSLMSCSDPLGTWQYAQAVCWPAGALVPSNRLGWHSSTNGRSA